jgi:hypothetical protein
MASEATSAISLETMKISGGGGNISRGIESV